MGRFDALSTACSIPIQRLTTPWTRAWTSLPAPVTALRATPISVSSRDGASTRTKGGDGVSYIGSLGSVIFHLLSSVRRCLLFHDPQ